MKEDLQKYARLPLKQKGNRVWRTYQGGAQIDQWKKSGPVTDGSFPEEWIMSTVTARGDGRPENEGQSIIETVDGEFLLRDLIRSHPEVYLGKRIAKQYGTTGVLIKMLDAAERLTIQVHPDKEYARTILNSQFGKTESWYVLNAREIDGEFPVVYMGFKTHVDRQLWKSLFDNQDISGMLDCLHKIPVQPGDAFMIYGGVPHAIGAGCFLMEVQEPTDYTMRTEKTTPNGLQLKPNLIHQGVGEQKMLDCFHYDTCTYEEALSRWKISPQIVEESATHTLRTLSNEAHTTCFALSELLLEGTFTLKGNDCFFVMVVYAGKGVITTDSQDTDYNQGDEIFISAAITQLEIKANIPSKILFCYPPSQ